MEIRTGSQICKGQPRIPALESYPQPLYRTLRCSSRVKNQRPSLRALAMGQKGRGMLSLNKTHKHWIELLPVLILFGALAGVAGGLAAGVMSLHVSSTTTAPPQ